MSDRDISSHAIRLRYDYANVCAITVSDRQVFASLMDVLVLLKERQQWKDERAELKAEIERLSTKS